MLGEPCQGRDFVGEAEWDGVAEWDGEAEWDGDIGDFQGVSTGSLTESQQGEERGNVGKRDDFFQN